MTSPATSPATESLSKAPSTSNPRLDIYLFNCGHGDTILIRTPDGRWGMIDCFLPKKDGVREAFFAFVETQQIQTLTFIIQTHPHLDHYHGMSAVIEHFVSRGQKIELYVDCGVDAQRAKHLLYGSLGGGEYQRLQDQLEEWAERKHIDKFRTAEAGHFPVRIGSESHKLSLLPLAPDSADKRRIMSTDLQKLANNAAARTVANDLSLVIALSAVWEGKVFNALLGADAELAGLEKALTYWNEHCREYSHPKPLNAVKIPHHGSKHSHHPRICDMKSAEGTAVAAVSAGIREALPDSRVLAEYLTAGWSVYTTTTRGTQRQPHRPMQLANRSRTTTGPQSHLVHLAWTPATGLIVAPPEASIRNDDLLHYETART